MERINSIEMYNGYVGAFISAHRDIFSNNYLGADEIKELISQKRLFCLREKHSIQFYRQEEGYMQVYLTGDINSPFDMETVSVPLLTEIIYTQKRDSLLEFERKIEALGFEKYHKNVQIVSRREKDWKRIEDESGYFQIFLREHGIECANIGKEEYEKVWKLWKAVIDTYALKKMGKAEVDEICLQKHGICLLDENMEICAAGAFHMQNHISNAKHIGVCEELKQSGMGAAVMLFGAQRAFEEGAVKHISWVSEDNPASMKIHKRIGEPSGRVSQQFVKLP